LQLAVAVIGCGGALFAVAVIACSGVRAVAVIACGVRVVNVSNTARTH